MAEVPESPYPIGELVTDQKLLQNRRSEIQRALEAVAPTDEGQERHAVLIGEPHSGRSSTLSEIARRAVEERERLVVSISGSDELIGSRTVMVRRLLFGIVEKLAEDDPSSEWYRAWRDRVYLRDTSPSNERDLISSALIFAADPDREIDRAILDRDLKALLDLAQRQGHKGVVIAVDDASPLTEDVALVEQLLDSFDDVGQYALLLAGLPTTAAHFTQAASACLNRFHPVRLRPFRGPHQLFHALSAPLPDSDRDYINVEDVELARDILQLTGGNPYEVMVVGHYLWLSCQLDEQEHYLLSPRVLDRVIPHLSMLAIDGDALRDGAQAIEQLPEEQVEKAVELAALSSLTIREIAIARILKVTGEDQQPLTRTDLSPSAIEGESLAVLSELEQLQDAGIIQLHDGAERFNVVGGRPASVVLKYRDRAQRGADVARQSFEHGFLFSVGEALARDAALGCLEALGTGNSLGFSQLMSSGGLGRLSPRPGIRSLAVGDGLHRLVEADIDLIPWNSDAYDRIAEIITEDEPSIAFLCTSLMYGGDQLEYMEVWQLPPATAQGDLDPVLSGVVEEWAPIVEAAGFRWVGSESAVLHGETARRALIVVLRFAATTAVHRLFNQWIEDPKSSALARARQVAIEAVQTLRETGQSDFELAGELSGMLSRLGFLNSFEDSRLEEAQEALEEAVKIGPADGWVTRWNAANVAARKGDTGRATQLLETVEGDLHPWSGNASILFFLPERAAIDSLVNITHKGIRPVLDLQIAVVSQGAPERALRECLESGDEGAAVVANWVSNALAAAPEGSP